MKKLKIFIGIIAMMFFAIGFSSCEKEVDLQNSENTPEYTQNPTDDFTVEIFKIEDGDTLNPRALFII